MKKFCVLMFFVGKMIYAGLSLRDSNLRDTFSITNFSVKLIDKSLSDSLKYYQTHMSRYFEQNIAQLKELKSFLGSYKFIPQTLNLDITFNETKSSPWDSIAPAILAKDFKLNVADLKPRLGGLSNWGRELFGGQKLTPEQRFMLRLQKALVGKINETTEGDKILEPLRCLLLANELIPAGIGKKTITEIFNSITNAEAKEFVMKKIMEQLKSVKINDGKITYKEGYEKTLAELVIENITDLQMKKALIRIAKLEDIDELKWQMRENFLAKLIENPNTKFDNDYITGLQKISYNGDRAILRDSLLTVKLSDLPATTDPLIE